jgi:hypothetical protein
MNKTTTQHLKFETKLKAEFTAYYSEETRLSRHMLSQHGLLMPDKAVGKKGAWGLDSS